MNNPICFDLEGPLCLRDNAYDLMKMIPSGDIIFEVISRYDDLLTMEGRADYEPGDTLALILPFLVLHDISEADIASAAAQATFTRGAGELVSTLQKNGWDVFCITTTYEQYALPITLQLGIPPENVACTKLSLKEIKASLCKDTTTLLTDIERDIIAMPSDDAIIKRRLDRFFCSQLPATECGRAISQVKPIGGRRKVRALREFSHRIKQSLSCWVAIGDSITDFRMLKEVDSAEGLSVAFNANQYALPYATMSLASLDIIDLLPVLESFAGGGRSAAEDTVVKMEKPVLEDNRGNLHWLSGRADKYDIIELHRRLRCLVREEAGRLG
jgi:energy-converting hydrogenase A subunit R